MTPPKSDLDVLTGDFIDAGMNENAAQIMVAALQLFAQKGYAATTVREIVRSADVTNPMLYYYFDSKKGVFLALMDALITSMEESVTEVLEQTTGLKDQLRAIAAAHFDACRNAPQVLRFVYSVHFGPIRSRPSYDLAGAYEGIHDLVFTVINEAFEGGEFRPRPGFDLQFLTERFMGLISLHLMDVLTLYDQAESQDVFDASVETYLGEAALDEMLEFYFYGAGDLAMEAS